MLKREELRAEIRALHENYRKKGVHAPEVFSRIAKDLEKKGIVSVKTKEPIKPNTIAFYFYDKRGGSGEVEAEPSIRMRSSTDFSEKEKLIRAILQNRKMSSDKKVEMIELLLDSE